MELKIAHLYPEVLNLYGDRGNMICMRKRLTWRGIGCRTDEITIGSGKGLAGYDLIFVGGGQDFEQQILMEDLRAGMAAEIRAAVADGTTFLCICGGYQMMGHYYETADGVRCGFTGAVDLYTAAGKKRQI